MLEASQAYKNWIELYDDKVEEVWNSQDKPKLKKAAMILYSLDRELNNIRKEAFSNFENVLQAIDNTVKSSNKECVLENIEANNHLGNEERENFDNNDLSGLNNMDCSSDFESPDLFKCTTKNKPKNPFLEKSPKLKSKKLKYARRHKKAAPVLSQSLLGSASNSDNSEPVQHIPEIVVPGHAKAISSDNKCSKKKSDVTTTPKENMLDSLIIESTPVISTTPKKSKAKNCRKNFLSGVGVLKSLSNDTTSVSVSQKSITTFVQTVPPQKKIKITSDDSRNSQTPSVMNVDEMVEYINRHKPGEDFDETNLNISLHHKNTEKSDVDNVKTDEKVPSCSKFKLSQNFLNDYNVLNKTIDKPQEICKEVVRGNARKKLPGWSCNDCKNFYEKLNLPPSELEKKMNLCSKHRARNKIDNTYAGFWDLDMAATLPEEKIDQSFVF